MVKVGKQDVRAVLKDIMHGEFEKQKKAEMDEFMAEQLEKSYSEYCKCGKIVTIDGKDKENTRIETVNGNRYLVGKCKFCGEEYYVEIRVQPPKSMLDIPTSRGYFHSKNQAYGIREEPENVPQKPRITVGTFKAP